MGDLQDLQEIEALRTALAVDDDNGYGGDLWGEAKIETDLGVFTHVKTQRGERHRWYDEMLEIYESPTLRFYALPWDRGHTESQEHEYHAENIHEVEPYEVTITKYREKKANG